MVVALSCALGASLLSPAHVASQEKESAPEATDDARTETKRTDGLDRIELENGFVQHGLVLDSGDNSIRLETRSGAARILKKEIRLVEFHAGRKAEARLANDLVEFRDGHSIEGDVQVIDGGRTVAIRVALPSGIAEGARPLMKYPMSDVERIRRRGELVEARRVYTAELQEEIDQALEKLESDDPKIIEEARKYLVDCGIFAIPSVRELHDELASETDDTPRRRALRSVLHAWEIKRLIPDEVQEFATDVYEILALEAEPHEKREFLKWVLPPYPEETKDLALYLVRNRDEDLSVRAFAVDFLRRLQLNRALVDLYNDEEGELELVAAVALARNRILVGAPTLIDALGLESERLRDLAIRTLEEATGESFRYRADGAPAAREASIARWRAWWESNQSEIERTSLLVLQAGTEESPQWREATRLWKEAHKAWLDKNLDAARELFEKSRAADPTFSKAVVSLAVLHYVERRDLAEAKRLLQSLVERPVPNMTLRDRFWTHYELGNVLRLEERWDDAIRHFDECIAMEPDSPLAYRARAETGWSAFTRSPAADDADEAKRRESLKKILADFERSHDLLVEALDKLTVLDADNLPVSETLPFARGFYNRSVFETRKGYEREIVGLKQSIARTHHALGSYDAAVKVVRGALDFLYINTDRATTRDVEAELRNYLAVLYERQGRGVDALEEYRRVLRQLDAENAISRRGIERLRRKVAAGERESGSTAAPKK